MGKGYWVRLVKIRYAESMYTISQTIHHFPSCCYSWYAAEIDGEQKHFSFLSSE